MRVYGLFAGGGIRGGARLRSDNGGDEDIETLLAACQEEAFPESLWYTEAGWEAESL